MTASNPLPTPRDHEPSPPDRDTPLHILVVDDERNVRRALRLILSREHYETSEAESAEMADQLFEQAPRPIDLIILDLMLPGVSGLKWLETLKSNPLRRHIPVIVISGHASGEDAVHAVKLGAFDYFEKPLARSRVLHAVGQALTNANLVRRVADLEHAPVDRYTMIGDSASMHSLHEQIARVAPTKASVLITGPSGTGKELVSRAIHRQSSRSQGPFVKVNCAAIPRELIESELFGHEKGAFTGADTQKRGVFEQAHGATLLLDEIGDMDLSAQAKVLRVLQSGEVSRVGSEHIFHVDVRILAATNKDLAEQVRLGRFREDLYFRLHVFPVVCPPLDDRKEDIPRLAQAFHDGFCADNGLPPKLMTDEFIAALMNRSWPGNVRELKNVVERAVILSADRITERDLEPDTSLERSETARTSSIESLPHGLSLREVREQAERAYILKTLQRLDWNVSQAARELQIERTHLHKKIRAHAIERHELTDTDEEPPVTRSP